MSEGLDYQKNQSLPSIYVAAHELKAPLVLMRQLVLELKSSGSPQTRTIERLILTVERSLRLVDQLTKTSRLEDGLFETEPLMAETVCRVVADELNPFARQHGQTISVRVSRRAGAVVGHRSLLVALLVNLCDNALQHNVTGESVVISAEAVEKGVKFSVRDYGPPMSRRQFEMIRSQTGRGAFPIEGDRPRSSGLGLWIASRFADTMQGQLAFIKHRSGGVTVSVLMPYSAQISLL
ncbi:HAMP domain-containing histidine kinase [Candidatus Saccharibacteria bacterium]|nr:HAMP domain-containing histidine kinase [Candidatus Saccharibacteria bacterium]NCU40311.1 HAMP domain-containing histidine kinase [Candidatus Saccharibacteria bacterium]